MKRVFALSVIAYAFQSFAFGQARIFQPNLISNDKVFGASFAPDGEAVYFVNSFGGRDTLQIFHSKKVNGHWQKPELAFFADIETKQIDPTVSPDGKTILFNVLGATSKIFEVYALYKTETGWSKPQRLSDAINSKDGNYFASISSKKNIYFTRSVRKGDIYVSRFVNGTYQQAVPMDSSINSEQIQSNPYISPNEDFMIYYSVLENGFGDSDLYISFRKKNKWSYPINLGNKVNSRIGEFCPSINFKNEMFYFSRTVTNNGKRTENIFEIPLAELNLKKLKKEAKFRE